MSSKKKYGFRSLRFKLALTSTLVEVVMLAFLIGNSVHIATKALEEQTRYRVREIVPLLNASLANPLVERDYATLDEILKRIVRKEGIEFISVADEVNHTVASVGEKSAAFPATQGSNDIDDISGYQHLEFPLTFVGQHIGQLHMSVDTGFLAHAIRSLQQEGLLIAGGEVVMTFILLALLGVLLTKNLALLADAARTMTEGNLTVRINSSSKDEIGATAQAFNTMAEQLQSSHNELEQRVAARTQDLYIAQDKLLRQERLATLGQLTATVSHELRNPLGVISNAAYYLKRKCDTVLGGNGGDSVAGNVANSVASNMNNNGDDNNADNNKVQQYLDMIEREVAAADRIISDLLATSSTKEPVLQWVDLDELLHSIVEPKALPDYIRWEYQSEPSPFMMRVDPLQLRQVLRNLVVNAVQAINSMGSSDAVIRLQAALKDGKYNLQLSDSGPGVDVEKRGNIFEPLFTTKAKGNGLGLWISRELIRSHGGEMRLKQSHGEFGGAMFEIEIPAPDGNDDIVTAVIKNESND
jgi:signal transduction histidine kinase